MDFTLKTRYWHNQAAMDAFKEFELKIHGIDFSRWESAGYWDDAYTPFSFFEGDTIVANVCVYLLDAIIDGEMKRLAQVSGVGTLPGWRRRGLNRRLTEIGLEWAKGRHDGVFLFADTDAIPFYRSCGFKAIDEYVEIVEAPSVPNRGAVIGLDPEKKHDLEKIHIHAKRRTPVSDKFSVLNEKLLMFHALYGLRNCVYEIPDLGCIIFFIRRDGCLRILDIVGEKIPDFRSLYPYIANENDKTIEFCFHTDKLGISETRTSRLEGNYPFTRNEFPVEDPVFPFTSRA